MTPPSWVETRRPVPPSGMVEFLRDAVPNTGTPALPGEPVIDPRELARASFELLAGVTAQPEGGRELARDLLAADALVTYAFETQAERDVDELMRLADFVAEERGGPGVPPRGRQDGV